MDNLDIILAALLGLSELLAFFPKVKANGIVQLILNFLKSLKKPAK